MKARLTTRYVQGVTKDASRITRHWDTEIKGFLLQVSPKGTMTYYYRYLLDGKKKTFKLGNHPDITPTQARKDATTKAGEVAKGVDVQQVKKANKRKSDNQKKTTLRGYIDNVYSDHLKTEKKTGEKILQNIAETTGGQYEPLGQQAEGLGAIYKQKLSLVPKHELSERMKRVPIDRFEWPLLLALILLVIEFAVSDRKPRRKRAPVIPAKNGADRRLLKGAKGIQTASLALAVMAFLLVSQKAYASPQSAEKAYNRGEYSLAAKEYKAAAKKAPDNTQLQFNLGAATYKDKKYKEALAAFQTAMKVREVPLQNKAYYNMGNTLYRQGEETEKSKPQDTIKHWEESIKAYEGALKLDPDDKDAHFNQEYVKKKLEALKKKQKQDKKQNNQSCKANNKKKDKDQKKNKNKNQDKNNKQDNKQSKNQKENKGQKGQNKPQGEQKSDQQKNRDQQKNKNQENY